MSRAGRRARMQRLIESGQWDGQPVPPRKRKPVTPVAGDFSPSAGARRLGWLWRHHNDGIPPVALAACWYHALESMRISPSAARKDDAA
jgi:hypothetical protein